MRRGLDRALALVCATCAAASAALFAGIVVLILGRGLPALRLDFVLDATGAALGSGGVRYQLLGTLLLVLTTLVLVTPLALGWARAQTLFVASRRRRRHRRRWP